MSSGTHPLLEPLEPRALLSAARFAVVGDFGSPGQGLIDVANLIHSWNPEFVVTVGDNNYPSGAANTIDANVGQNYARYILNYQGAYGPGSPTQRFYAALGNHDWGNRANNPTGANPHLAYFTLPGNERYYDFVQGPVHFFVVDSDANEPSGVTSTSIQALWLQAGLATATEPYKLVVVHHPPYSSGDHGNTVVMQWPFAQWGATAVLAGHDHDYERLNVGGLTYIVNGLGGRSVDPFVNVKPGSQVRYSGDYGAMLVDANDSRIQFQFYTRTGLLIDSHDINVVADAVAPTVTSKVFALASPRMSVRMQFSETVFASASAGDLQLRNLTTNTTIPSSAIALNYEGLTDTANFIYTGASSGILPDGDYRATLPAGSVQDPSGNALAADATVDFFVLTADANRDRRVSLTDFATLAASFNQTAKGYGQGNFSLDPGGAVDLVDFTMLASNFNASLPGASLLARPAAVAGPPAPALFASAPRPTASPARTADERTSVILSRYAGEGSRELGIASGPQSLREYAQDEIAGLLKD